MFKQELEGEYLKIATIQEDEQETILGKPNVVGVGVGHKVKDGRETGDTCLTVFVSSKLDPGKIKDDDRVGDTMGKFKTDVVETGEIFAGGGVWHHPATVAADTVGALSLKKRSRPAEGGCSVGHFTTTAGTLGTGAIDRSPFPGLPKRYYILGNNHVLANSNYSRIGDPILQPGPYDGGTLPADQIARLSRYVPLLCDGSPNYVDAAIAEGEFHDINREIYWIGYINGLAGVKVGSVVRKTGRSTSYTTGRVTALNATVTVGGYYGGQSARFVKQIATTSMSAGGDSGSVTCDLDGNAVGLLFAGGTTASFHNEIGYVVKELEIRI